MPLLGPVAPLGLPSTPPPRFWIQQPHTHTWTQPLRCSASKGGRGDPKNLGFLNSAPSVVTSQTLEGPWS